MLERCLTSASNLTQFPTPSGMPRPFLCGSGDSCSQLHSPLSSTSFWLFTSVAVSNESWVSTYNSLSSQPFQVEGAFPLKYWVLRARSWSRWGRWGKCGGLGRATLIYVVDSKSNSSPFPFKTPLPWSSHGPTLSSFTSVFGTDSLASCLSFFLTSFLVTSTSMWLSHLTCWPLWFHAFLWFFPLICPTLATHSLSYSWLYHHPEPRLPSPWPPPALLPAPRG